MAEAPTFTTAEQTLARATDHYKKHLYSPEYLSEFMQASWNFDGIQRMNLYPSDVVVPQAPYTESQIWQFMKLDDPSNRSASVDLGFFLPEILSSTDGLILMGVGFPKTNTWALRPNHNIKNFSNPYGWMRVDAGMDAPFRRTNEGELKERIKSLGRMEQSLNIYASSGEAIKRIFDYYPDERLTWWSRLLLCSGAGRVLDACFGSDGGLFVRSGLRSGCRGDALGGRSFLGA
ncbi:hypothetical protein A2617_03590 [Candidatus Daviesbacteria bacterium RIFOXYD1_FULL_41_10]|uniref:Uncharacterized protein n=1 Tax=Candidatus Daviesbacteria bacterium RIFOXYD1_FULL_41_10 TaxID=1797801 RepID=A0A1F5N0X4_9BACT|nr:MAG: hypothetical protein A2617_03590 [Candidatus Daviesbacteria bacterium RIFOXYD1_FULL_41_10]